MKIRQVLKNGRKAWRVSYRGPDGKYHRKFFRSPTAASDWVGGEKLDAERMGRVWLDASAVQRTEMVAAWERAQSGGYSLSQALDAWEARPTTPAGITMRQLVDRFEVAKRSQGLRPRSLFAVTNSAHNFAEALPDAPAASVTPADIAAHLDRPAWSQRRRLGVLRDLRTLFGWAVRQGVITSSPAAGVDSPIVEVRAPSLLTPDDAKRLMDFTRTHEPAMMGLMALALFAGLRPEAEIWRLSRESIDLANGRIEVQATGKTRRRRLVDIQPNLRAWLELWLPMGHAPRPVNWQRRWWRIRDGCGFNGCWPQDGPRHSFASYTYALRGETFAAAQCGHSPQMLHEHYRGLVTAKQAEAWFAIFPTEK